MSIEFMENYSNLFHFMGNTLPEWQLPPGVSRNLWDVLNDSEHARGYDARLAGSQLLEADQRFVEKHCCRPGRLIDLGCGTGRLLIPLAQRGYWVLGVDLSEEMLRIVSEKAAAAGATVHRLKANLVELEGLADGTFDFATCLFSTLGMVAGRAARRRAVEHIHRLLRPGGIFILHVHNRWFNFWDQEGRHWLIADLARSLLDRGAAGDRGMPGEWGQAGLTLHHFTRREAVGLLRDAGFELVDVQPVSLRPDGQLRWPAWFGWLRSYGYLLASRRAG